MSIFHYICSARKKTVLKKRKSIQLTIHHMKTMLLCSVGFFVQVSLFGQRGSLTSVENQVILAVFNSFWLFLDKQILTGKLFILNSEALISNFRFFFPAVTYKSEAEGNGFTANSFARHAHISGC